MIRFSDFIKYKAYRLVIMNIEQNNFFMNDFLKFDAFFPFEKENRYITVIFPKYKFRSAYLKYPIRLRKMIGKNNVFVEMYKKDYGVINFTRLEKWAGETKSIVE